MKIEIEYAREISNAILKKIGFCDDDIFHITGNIIFAEMSGKASHGLIRLPWFYGIKEHLNTSKTFFKILKDDESSFYIDAKNSFGIPVIQKSLDYILKEKSFDGVFTFGIKDLDYSGYITEFARKVVAKDLIFISFNNSPARLIPYGAKKRFYGTNPITIAIPSSKNPVILDMATSNSTYGSLLLAADKNEKLDGVGLDLEGNKTDRPSAILDRGGIFPFSEVKGSGLGFVIEFLAGAMTGSMVTNAVKGGWGSFSMILNPALFRPLDDFKRDVDTAISGLKNLEKADGFSEIFFAGEKSLKSYEASCENGFFEISDSLYDKLISLGEF